MAAAPATAAVAAAANSMAVNPMRLNWSKAASRANPGHAPKTGKEDASAAKHGNTLAWGE